ncbi:hypothetical protein WR25_21382 [Diploscapter pachys]|uniref:A-kinase anchor protein 7-like phosphoesterase domain-containing protein n=1 Tax=Diploscapter pachys TaxID=2018661 RepID=A0A2A2K335_9BILA|nr:hypothetical protein WR25_21382 [Diploscapter pachys]
MRFFALLFVVTFFHFASSGKNQRINAFVGCRINSPDVIAQKTEVEDILLSRDKRFTPYIQDNDKLHITLDVFNIQDEQWKDAKQAMTELAMELCYFKHNLTIRFNGTNHFGNSILYGQLGNDATDKFTRMHGIIRNRFALHGIKTADKWPDYHPHMTIVDLPQNETELGEIITNIYGMLRFTPVQDIDSESNDQFENACDTFDKVIFWDNVMFGFGRMGAWTSPKIEIEIEIELSKEDIQLPVAFSHFREPWVRHHNSKIFESEVFDRNWRKVFQRKVQGLNDTVQGVFDWLSKSNCLFFAWGGSVRDAVTGILPLYYIDKCQRPHPGSFKLTIGGDSDELDDELSVEPLDFAHWNTSFEVHPSKFEYSPNTLSVMFEGRSSSLRALLIDISGFSLNDVCGRIIRIPAKEEFWNEWATEKSIIKVYRYWKLRAAGYFPWTDDEKNFLVDFTRNEFTESSFFTFVCHYVLSGNEYRF